MNNKQIYRKTLVFSVKRLLWDILSFVIIVVTTAAGFLLAEMAANQGLIGLAIGIIVGIIIVAIASHFISYVFKAGQIAMMTKAIDEGKLPDDVYGEGKKIVKERFLTVAAYYAATRVIKAVFREIGNLISSVGQAVGGDSGNAIGSTISSIIQTIVAYLCDCCLGWVFLRKEINAAKASLEGAVLFFRKGKALAKNLGRIFGIGLLSLVTIGGAFFGIFYLITLACPEVFEAIAREFTEIAASEDGASLEFLTNPQNVALVASGIAGLIMWSIIHSTFIRPFILVGVLRNYIEAGKEEKITENDFAELDGKSKKFAKLHKEANAR